MTQSSKQINFYKNTILLSLGISVAFGLFALCAFYNYLINFSTENTDVLRHSVFVAYILIPCDRSCCFFANAESGCKVVKCSNGLHSSVYVYYVTYGANCRRQSPQKCQVFIFVYILKTITYHTSNTYTIRGLCADITLQEFSEFCFVQSYSNTRHYSCDA